MKLKTNLKAGDTPSPSAQATITQVVSNVLRDLHDINKSIVSNIR